MLEKKKIILAVDDNLATLTTIRSILEGTYEVSLAKNIEIARTILQTTKVDLILLDIEMPGVSGMEFLEEIHNDGGLYHIPVIMVSSYGTAEVIINTQKGGADDFVVKPISPPILLEKIRSVFKSARKKINYEALGRKLNKLENSCAIGKSSHVEKMIQELEQVYCDIATDMEIAEICRYARDMEYSLVAGKVQLLATSLPTTKNM